MTSVWRWAPWALAGLAACAAPGRASFESEFDPDRVAREPRDEPALAERPTLAGVLRVARAHNPELGAARARAEAAFARVPAAGRLPDLQVKTEMWGAPLVRPWAWNEAGTLMIGVRQELPAPGVRDAEARASEEDARAAGESWRVAELDVVREVQEAWAAYELATKAIAIHLEQIDLAGTLVDLARTLIASGRVSQDDVFRLDLEQARLHRDVVELERDQRAAVVRLNALMGRDVGAPLGPPEAADVIPTLPERAALEQLALAHRPELAAAGHEVRAREAEARARHHEASRPSFMVGADYMVMPEAEEVHGYGLMLAVNLPWLSGGRAAEARAADAELRAREREVGALRSAVVAEVGVAHAEVEAATRALIIIRDELLPRARRGFESARSTFSTGGGSTLAVLEALRMWLDVRIEEAHAEVDLRMAWARLERATGTSLGEERP